LGADSHINGGLHVAGLIYVDGDITQGTAGTYSQFRQMQIIDGGLVVEAGGIEINLGDLFVDGYANSAPDNRFFPPAYPTAHAPTYAVGAMYYDTTLNKLRIGGASAWETVTSV
jgi:hypothetical protein